jgi:hypothetical protein
MKRFFLLLSLAFIFFVSFSPFELSPVHAQSTSALQAEQAAAQQYAANPTVANKNILLSAMNTVNTQANTPGNVQPSNAQSVEQSANNALNNTPAPANSPTSVNQATAQQIQQQSAQTASIVAQGGSCAPTSSNGNEQPCATGLTCDHNDICNPPPANNSVGVNGYCDGNDSACQTGLTCNTDQICVSNAAAASSPSPATSGSGNFVPLTNLPIFNTSAGLTTAINLSAFFNALYKYCIGIAATLAVLQIMRAGIMYMGGDSITETKEARRLIASAVGGLVLVLSPYVIFSIINPNILSLNLGTDLSGLNPGASNQSSPASATVSPAQPTSVDFGEVTSTCNNGSGGSLGDLSSCGTPAAGSVNNSTLTSPPAPTTLQTTDGQTVAPVSTSYGSSPSPASNASPFNKIKTFDTSQ